MLSSRCLQLSLTFLKQIAKTEYLHWLFIHWLRIRWILARCIEVHTNISIVQHWTAYDPPRIDKCYPVGTYLGCVPFSAVWVYLLIPIREQKHRVTNLIHQQKQPLIKQTVKFTLWEIVCIRLVKVESFWRHGDRWYSLGYSNCLLYNLNISTDL